MCCLPKMFLFLGLLYVVRECYSKGRCSLLFGSIPFIKSVYTITPYNIMYIFLSLIFVAAITKCMDQLLVKQAFRPDRLFAIAGKCIATIMRKGNIPS